MLNRIRFVPFLLCLSLVFLCISVPCIHARHAGGEHDHESPDHEHEPSESISRNDFTLMVKIPSGTFKMGSTFQEINGFLDECRKVDKACRRWWFDDEYPDRLVYLDSYWIDIFEVTNEKYLEFVKLTGHRPALDASCKTEKCREGNLWDDASFPERVRNQPVTQVSWFDAEAYCKGRGKRLPTEAEWEKAARGPSGSKFPWGNASPKGRATYLRKWHDVFTLTDVGSYSQGASIYGVYDLAGNVWEWAADWYGRHYYNRSTKRNPKGPGEGEFKVVRGGSWVNYPNTLRSAARRWSRPEVLFNDTGFRCAKDATDETQTN